MAITTAVLASCGGEQTQTIQNKSIPDYPIIGGVSAPFAGVVDGQLIVAGGCNFPDKPVTEGGKKVFYAKSYSVDLNAPDTVWTEQTDIKTPAAYGAAVETPAGLVCAGGQCGTETLRDVYIIKYDKATAKTAVDTLQPLPVGIDNGGWAYASGKVIVTGGNQQDGGKGLYALDAAAPQQWEKLTEYPGPKRVQPIVVSDGTDIYVAGGFQLDAETKESTLSTNVIKYSMTTGEWTELAEIPADKSGAPRCLVGGSGVFRRGCLILTGGVNYVIFKDAIEGKGPSDYMLKPREWYQFNKDILIYDLATGEWRTVYDVQGMNKAGGILVADETNLYMVCGELKPGIRTPEIATCPISALFAE